MFISRPKRKLFFRVTAYILYFIAFITLVALIASIFDSSSNLQGALIGLIMIVIPFALLGYLLQRYFLKKEKFELEQYENNIVFTFAEQSRGIVNSIEFSQYAQIPEEYANKLLNDMVLKGKATVEANNNGYLEYIFPVYIQDNN